MKWLWRTLATCALVAVGFWLWTYFHPPPDVVIRKQLRRLAVAVSFQPGESDLARLAKVAALPNYFKPDVEVKLAFRDYAERGVITQEFIQTAAASMRQYAPGGLQVEFLDVNVAIAPGQAFATAELTMKATTAADQQFQVQEMKIALQRTNDVWLIYRVETVRTLE